MPECKLILNQNNLRHFKSLFKLKKTKNLLKEKSFTILKFKPLT